MESCALCGEPIKDRDSGDSAVAGALGVCPPCFAMSSLAPPAAPAPTLDSPTVSSPISAEDFLAELNGTDRDAPSGSSRSVEAVEAPPPPSVEPPPAAASATPAPATLPVVATTPSAIPPSAMVSPAPGAPLSHRRTSADPRPEPRSIAAPQRDHSDGPIRPRPSRAAAKVNDLTPATSPLGEHHEADKRFDPLPERPTTTRPVPRSAAGTRPGTAPAAGPSTFKDHGPELRQVDAISNRIEADIHTSRLRYHHLLALGLPIVLVVAGLIVAVSGYRSSSPTTDRTLAFRAPSTVAPSETTTTIDPAAPYAAPDSLAGGIAYIEADRCEDLISASGVLVSPTHLITSADVTASTAVATVRFHDGKAVEATVIGFDRETNLALLELPEAQDQDSLAWGNPSVLFNEARLVVLRHDGSAAVALDTLADEIWGRPGYIASFGVRSTQDGAAPPALGRGEAAVSARGQIYGVVSGTDQRLVGADVASVAYGRMRVQDTPAIRTPCMPAPTIDDPTEAIRAAD